MLDAPPAAIVIPNQVICRTPMPERRRSFTLKYKVGGHSLYLTCGLYPDGRLGEIFLDFHKFGTAARDWMVETARTFSTSLQFGIPLRSLVEIYKNSPGDPRGRVSGHPTITSCSSVMDLIARVLEAEFLTGGTRDA